MYIDGKKTAAKIQEKVREEVVELQAVYGRAPCLAVILVGDDPASQVYVRNKERACKKVGITSLFIHKEATLKEDELLALIDAYNEDPAVDGILVQLPLPDHIDEMKVIERISPSKDVDGFHPESIAGLFLDRDTFQPCTPLGVMALLDEIGCCLDGKEVVVVGRSHNVGKPIAMLCLRRNATVTICHSHTSDLAAVTKRADVLIVAAGKEKLIGPDHVKEGAVVIDVGINRMANGKLCGDVDTEAVKDKVSAITPVPGGVGPMTVAMLMSNTVRAFRKRMEK